MKPTSEVPERIAITGNFGTGKTEASTAWAYWLRKTETPGTVYILNCERDGSVQRANERFPDWRANIQFTDVNNWTDLTNATNLYVQVAGPGDLIVIDGSDKPWAWVRDLWAQIETKKTGQLPPDDDPFAMMADFGDKTDWNAINAAYFRWFNSLIMGSQPAHVLLSGPSQPLKVPVEKNGKMTWGDSKETLDLFSHHGVRWAGQKRMGFDVQTLLLAGMTRETRTLTTMKDAGGRTYLDKAPVGPVEEGGFVFGYLVGCAGWSL